MADGGVGGVKKVNQDSEWTWTWTLGVISGNGPRKKLALAVQRKEPSTNRKEK